MDSWEIKHSTKHVLAIKAVDRRNVNNGQMVLIRNGLLCLLLGHEPHKVKLGARDKS